MAEQNTMDSNKVILAFKRLAFADLAFIQAHALAQFLSESEIVDEDPLYAPMFAGICVTYSKPFQGAEGLGPLPSQFSEFPADSPFALVHADLLESRNRIYAHRDLLSVHILSASTAEETVRVEVDLQPDGFTVFATEPQWPKSRVNSLIELCEFQRTRLKDELHKKLVSLCTVGGKTYKAGHYTLGVDFP